MLLHEIGQALYGTQWQSDLGRALGVNVRTVQRWAAGEIVPPAGVYVELLKLARDRSGELGALMPRIEEAARAVSEEARR